MKNSKLILEKGKSKEEYNIILKVEAINKEYILYTKGETDSDGEVIAYAAIFEENDGKQLIKPLEDNNMLEFLDSILINLQNKISTKEESE